MGAGLVRAPPTALLMWWLPVPETWGLAVSCGHRLLAR